jgi:FMN phosphatase YigB (HAD superfamily)
MKNPSPAELDEFRSVSFDIDGTLYPISKVQLRWWKKFFFSPRRAIRFYQIKKTWEFRRLGNSKIQITPDDVLFFEKFLTSMLDPSLVPGGIRKLIDELKKNGKEIFFLSDHGATEKLSRLGLTGTAINCLSETGELKPHQKISELLREKYRIVPETHVHLGDRWTDEEQAKMFGCSFRSLQL